MNVFRLYGAFSSLTARQEGFWLHLLSFRRIFADLTENRCCNMRQANRPINRFTAEQTKIPVKNLKMILV